MGKPFFWKAKQAWYVNYTKRDGRPGRRRLEAKNENQARKAWAEIYSQPENPNVIEIADDFVEHLTQRHAFGEITESHIDSVKRAVRAAIPDNLRWNTLTPMYLDRYAAKQNWSASTIRTRFTHLKSLANWGAKHCGLKDVLIELRKPSVERREKSISKDEYLALLDHIFRNDRSKDHRIANLLAVMWHTGARPGELWRAKWSELQNDRIILKKHKNAKKTGKLRIIYLPPAATVAIRMCEGWHEEHIFAATRGTPWTKDAFSARLNRMLADAKLDPQIVGYSFRHAYATRALASGIDIAVLAELMGTPVAMIEKHYGHLSERKDLLRSMAMRVK